MARIFISYSRKDEAAMKRFVTELEKTFGADGIFYDTHITGGKPWWNNILEKIGDATVFVYLISNNSLASYACRAEYMEAMRLGKHIVPVDIANNIDLAYTDPPLAFILRKINRLKANQMNRVVRAITEGLSRSNATYYRDTIQNFGMADVAGENVNIGGTNNYNITYVVQGEQPIAEPAAGTAPPPERDTSENPWYRKPEFVIGAVMIPIVAAMIGGLIQISPTIFQRDTPTPTESDTAIVQENTVIPRIPGGGETESLSEEDARATGAAQAYATLTALAPTDALTATTTTLTQIPSTTPTDALTATTTPTQIPSRTPHPTNTPPATDVSPTLSDADGPTAIVNVASANLREGPGTEYSIAGSADNGETLPIVAQSDDWYLIERSNMRQAWVWSGIVDVVNLGNSSITVAATVPDPPQTQPVQQVESNVGEAKCIPPLISSGQTATYQTNGTIANDPFNWGATSLEGAVVGMTFQRLTSEQICTVTTLSPNNKPFLSFDGWIYVRILETGVEGWLISSHYYDYPDGTSSSSYLYD